MRSFRMSVEKRKMQNCLQMLRLLEIIIAIKFQTIFLFLFPSLNRSVYYILSRYWEIWMGKEGQYKICRRNFTTNLFIRKFYYKPFLYLSKLFFCLKILEKLNFGIHWSRPQLNFQGVRRNFEYISRGRGQST